MLHFRPIVILKFISIIIFSSKCYGQPCTPSVRVISDKEELTATFRENPDLQFVALKKLIPDIVVDLKYGTQNNFTGIKLYRNPTAYLRSRQAIALKAVQEELKKNGLGLKVFDAYRPYGVTCKMWRSTTSHRYVANPRKGSHHNRGIAVDLTIIKLATGEELNMGTGFDNFTEKAHHTYTNLPKDVLENRRLLKHVMWKHGFNYVPNEWWHYHWRDKNYDVVDLDFDELK